MANAGGDKHKRMRGSSAARTRAKRNEKENASRLQKLVKAVGNEEISKRLGQGRATRDEMMAHLLERLHLVRKVQQREVSATRRGAHWPWWRLVADSHKRGWDKPEPTRWRQTAQLYEEAAHVLCKGDLRRGKRLMDQAMAEETAQWDKLSGNVVDLHSMEFDCHGQFEDAAVQAAVDDAPATGACEVPLEVRALADEIQRVEVTVDDPMNRRRRRDPWWTLEEEEEEEEADGAGGG